MSSHSYATEAYQSKDFTLVPESLDYLVSNPDDINMEIPYTDPFKSPVCLHSDEAQDESKIWAEDGIINFTN